MYPPFSIFEKFLRNLEKRIFMDECLGRGRKKHVSFAPLFVFVVLTLSPLVFYKGFFAWYCIKLYLIQFCLLCVFIVLSFQIFFQKHVTFVFHPLHGLVFAYYSVCLIFTIFSKYPIPSVREFIVLTSCVLAYFALSQCVKNLESLRRALVLSCVAAFLIAFLAIVQTAFGLSHTLSFITIGNKNLMGAFLLLNLFIPGSLVIVDCWEKKKSKGRVRFKLGMIGSGVVVTLVLLLGIAIARSVGVSLSLLVTLFVFGFLLVSDRAKPLYVIITLLFSVILLYLCPGIQNLITLEFQEGVRQYLWQGAWAMFHQNVFFGSGFGAFFVEFPVYCPREFFLLDKSVFAARHAHNLLLELGAEMGVWGLVSFLAIVAYMFYKIVILVRSNKEALGKNTLSYGLNVLVKRRIFCCLMALFLGLLGIFFHNLVSIDLQMIPTAIPFWAMLGVFTGGLIVYDSYDNPRGYRKQISFRSPVHIIVSLMIMCIASVLFYKVSISGIMSQRHMHQGMTAYNGNDFQTSATHFQRALDHAVGDEKILWRLAFQYAQMGRTEDAIKTYENLSTIAPYYSRLQSNLGRLYVKQGNLQKAIENFRKALFLDPFSQEGVVDRIHLGKIYIQMGEHYKGLEELRIAKELSPDDSKIAELYDKMKNEISIFLRENK